MVKVCYIFRKRGIGYSIETLFDNIINHLPNDISAKKVILPYHNGIIPRLKNLEFLKKLDGCDIYHITGDVYYSALVLPGHKTIITLHDIESLFTNRNLVKKHLINLFWLKLPLKKANIITTISAKTLNEIKTLYPAVATKSLIIPNCIEDQWFSAPRFFSNKNPDTGLVIGTKPNKNLKNIAEAAKNTGIKLIIVGKLTDEQKQWLKQVPYTQYTDLPRTKLREIYTKAGFLLFPSTYEGFGLPVIEAQALGIPVITSNKEPMKTVSGGSALLVNPYDPEDIARAIDKLRYDHNLRHQLITQGFENAREYRCSKIALLYANIYKRITQNAIPA